MKGMKELNAPRRPDEAGFPLRYNKLRGMRPPIRFIIAKAAPLDRPVFEHISKAPSYSRIGNKKSKENGPLTFLEKVSYIGLSILVPI